MARAGSSSKFVPVNLNKSYGQPLPLSNGGAFASAGLSRSRSFGGSHGGMVSLSRSSRVSSSSTTVSATSRASKLAVPRPVNLPSLRREHAGNDPTVALVGSSGSSGWTKQAGEETADSSAVRSDALTSDSTWGNPPVFQARSASVSDGANQNAGKPSVYTPPGSRIAVTHGTSAPVHLSPVEKAVVFRGEDFPTLQAVAAPPSPLVPPQQRQRDLQQKQRDKLYEVRDQQKKMQQISQQHQNTADDVPHSEHLSDPQLQPAQPTWPQGRGTLSEQADSKAERAGGHSHGPSPLIRLPHTSNWADDERETLSSFRKQERAQSVWVEPGDGYGFADSWAVDHKGDIDFRRPTSRNGYLGRKNADLVIHASSVSKGWYDKEGDNGFANGGTFEPDYRGDAGRLSSSIERNDFLKRAWSFSATESNYNRDARFGNSNNGNGWERDTNDRVFFRDGNMLRHDAPAWDMSSRDGQGQEYRFGKDAFLGKQGLSGGRVSQGDRNGRGNGFLYGGSDASILRKSHSGNRGRQDQIGLDYGREKRASIFHAQLHNDDPFLEDVISTRAGSFFGTFGLNGKGSRQKKDASKDDYLQDPARESFEAELERVQKMLEQERQRVVEERERAIELARKEQEEQERLAREEEQLRLKLEEEAREAASRAQREAEEAARKIEEVRRAREDEKHMIVQEEERRKEAARRKLSELEERMAKRESERRRDEALQKEKGFTARLVTEEVSMQSHDSRRWNSEMDSKYLGKSVLNSGKVEEDDDECAPHRLGLPAEPSSLRSLLKSPSLLPYVKEGHGFSIERTRPVQTWKREALDSGHGLCSAQKGSPKSSHPQDDLPQLDREQQQRGISFRNLNLGAPRNLIFTDTQDKVPIDNPNGIDAGDWWGKDGPSRSQPPLETYSYGADAADYPSFGRLRQSLPKQPRVLPPPPGQATLRKQAFQPDDTKSVASVTGMNDSEVASKSREDFTLRTGCEVDVRHETGNEDSVLIDVQVSKQFDSVASEEVVLSDAGSQFSDDTVEDALTPAVQPYQEQYLHSDVVSETYTEEDVDERSDLTEAQESSEEVETQMPTNFQESKGEEPTDNRAEGIVQARKDDMCDCLGAKNEVEEEESQVVNEEDKVIEEEDKVIEENENSGKDTTSRYLTEDLAVVNMENQTPEDGEDECALEETDKPADLQREDVTADEQLSEGNSKDLASEIVQDQVVQPLTPLSSVKAVDAAQMGHSEGFSSRQSLVQQFQQPFSFMAVPLPQSSTLSNVAANPSMLSSVHGLQNQQELPFHLQLGLLPGVPLMPNAIQIGSIQMPLHIHPQIPQLAHLHGQQPPVFQFGQIGHSVPINQPLPMMQSAVQIHHVLGQGILPHHHLSQAESLNITDTVNTLVNSDQLPKMGEDAAAQKSTVSSVGYNPAVDRFVEINQLASRSSGGSASEAEWKDQAPFVAPEAKAAAVPASKPGISVDQAGQKTSVENMFGSPYGGSLGDSSQADQNAGAGGRPSRGRRRNSGLRYHGILGRGRGRSYAGQNYEYQARHLAAETWPESGTKGAPRGKMFRRNFRRVEYRACDPLPPLDGKSAAAEMPQALDLGLSNMEESKEGGGYRYVKRETGSNLRNLGDENRQNLPADLRPMQAAAKGDRPVGENRLAISSGTKGLLRKYEADSVGDAPLRTGVVCVFEQPGIETQNDKDDFIKVRSKRQLLREQREQREKESKVKAMESGAREQVAKKQQRSSAKAGLSSAAGVVNSSKNSLKRRSARSTETAATEGRIAMQRPPGAGILSPMMGTTATNTSSDCFLKRISTSRKPGQATSPSNVIHVESGNLADSANNSHRSEQSTTAAWGGQRSNQEVVSFTQIQLEEAMKPFRLEGPSQESVRMSERALIALEPGVPHTSALSFEKAAAPVKAPGPISSLLAGEKIQFGAVTSPTLIASSSSPPSPLSVVRIGSPLGIRSDSSHIPSHSNRHVTNFLESDGDSTFTSEGRRASRDDGFQGKIVDLEAEAEAAASAVAAAAISSEDLIETHSNPRVSVLNGGGTAVVAGSNADSISKSSGLPVTRSVIVQAPDNAPMDNPIAVALPADLSIETPPTLFQGSSISLPASSGVMIQSFPGGASPFPCLEMGPMLGGPIFTFGPREDASVASLEPGLAAWQQRHVGTPDSFYGAPPFMSPAGLPSIQGHPHMLVYANPFTPVGQFGQLGVSFMGAAYHPSGKQPDWTHIPLPSLSSGALGLNDGDISAGSNGMMASQHINGASSLSPLQLTSMAGSSVMPVAAPLSLFDTGLSSPFQIQHIDGLVQSNWSKAPAPPVHSVPISLPAPPLALGVNMQPYHSRTLSNQLGHLPHFLDASSGFHQSPVLNPVTSSSFSSADAGAQFPDELGLGDCIPSGKALLSDAGGPLSDIGHASISASVGNKLQRGRRLSRGSQGHLNGVNSSSNGELAFGTSSQGESRSGLEQLQSKNLAQMGFSGVHSNSLPFAEQRASQQGLARDGLGPEWSGSNHKKAASGRTSTADRGGSALSVKLKQIYVAKPAAASKKLSAACS